MCEYSDTKHYIKILDKETAAALIGCGFSYMKETGGKEGEVFVFEKSAAVAAALKKLSAENFGAGVAVEEDMLRF